MPSAADVFATVEEIGYPLILKPIAGAGCTDTFHVRDKAELIAALAAMGGRAEASCERIDGEEFTYDTVCIDGRPMMENVTRVHSSRSSHKKLMEWISPFAILRPRHEAAEDRGRRRAGRGVLKALGMGDGFTHMEWYLAQGRGRLRQDRLRPGGAGSSIGSTTPTTPTSSAVGASRAGHHHAGRSSRKVQRQDLVFKRAGLGHDPAHHEPPRLHYGAGGGSWDELTSAPAPRAATGKQTQVSDPATSWCGTQTGTPRSKMCEMAAKANIKMMSAQ